ncbi:MAG: sigma-70 family RNA polymerase sigma factor [Acidobacteriota bacterium]
MISTLLMANVLAGSRMALVANRNMATDDELVALFLRKDDEEAFEVLVRRYQDRIFSLAISILGYGRESEAEDVTQEVFVDLFRTLRSFRQECAFSTWFYRLARNRIIDHQRRIVRRESRRDSNAQAMSSEDEMRADPLSAVVASQRHAQLLSLIERLPALQRITLHLYYWQEQSTAEIAELLELKPNTVKSYLFRARQSLAAALGGEASHD